MIKKCLIAVAGIAFIIGCTQTLEKRANIIKPPESVPGAQYIGMDQCLECHDGYAQEKRNNVHLRLASFEVIGGYKSGCEGCHGPGSKHAEADGDPTKILRFGHDGIHGEEVAGVCTTCHSDQEHLAWAGSAHANEDVGCNECHKVHANKNKTLLKDSNQFELCGQCHADIKAKGYFMSHHPVKEGKMGCTDCHNPHGTLNPVPGMIKTDERLNDLCLSCHTRYQGPFVFEHDPVVEDCSNCHEPHGTVANNLLKQNEPFLCLQCHEAHFHATRASSPARQTGYPPNVIDPYTGQKPTAAQLAGTHSWQAGFLTKCTQCHQQVHGSDLPSQAGTGGGKFTR